MISCLEAITQWLHLLQEVLSQERSRVESMREKQRVDEEEQAEELEQTQAELQRQKVQSLARSSHLYVFNSLWHICLTIILLHCKCRVTCLIDFFTSSSCEFIRAGTNTTSDEYDSYREYRVANTNMYSRINFFLRGY